MKQALAVIIVLLVVYLMFYVTGTPIRIMIEDNEYREADIVCIWMPDVECN
jgi:hypothetical protein